MALLSILQRHWLSLAAELLHSTKLVSSVWRQSGNLSTGNDGVIFDGDSGKKDPFMCSYCYVFISLLDWITTIGIFYSHPQIIIVNWTELCYLFHQTSCWIFSAAFLQTCCLIKLSSLLHCCSIVTKILFYYLTFFFITNDVEMNKVSWIEFLWTMLHEVIIKCYQPFENNISQNRMIQFPTFFKKLCLRFVGSNCLSLIICESNLIQHVAESEAVSMMPSLISLRSSFPRRRTRDYDWLM